MKAFLRNIGAEQYVWKDVEYANGQFLYNGRNIDCKYIIAIADDDRNKFVKCPVCGKEFLKDSEEWYNHTTKTNDTSKCFTCRYLRESNSTVNSTTYELVENGEYAAVRTYKTCLQCTNCWPAVSIAKTEARNHCVYNRCVGASPVAVSDIFTQYPGVFDSMATVKQVIKCGYKDSWCAGTETIYRLKGKNDIEVVVNSLQIVDHIRVWYKRNGYTIYYSEKYNKYFTEIWNGSQYTYAEWDRPRGMSEETFEYIKKKIASFYA